MKFGDIIDSSSVKVYTIPELINILVGERSVYIKRQIFPKLFNLRKSRKITVLTGAGQVGKTTLLKELYNRVGKNGNGLFLDLDIYSNYEKVNSYENMLNTLKLNGFDEKQERGFYLFLDEFQRYADISMILKNLYDHHKNIKVYASGSSSLVINSRLQDSLAGRKNIVNIYPLNFSEFLLFKRQENLIEKLQKLTDILSENMAGLLPEAYELLDEFMTFGGYPEVVLSGQKKKKQTLSSIFDLYVSKDLVDYLKVDNIRNVKTMIQLLAVNNGSETQYNKLSQSVGVDEKTIKNYIEILRQTFLILIQTPWFTNKKKEIVKQPKIYFSDSGVCNFFINNFNPMHMRNDASFLFEGFVISEFIKHGVNQDLIKFWRTKNRHEVDMIFEKQGEQIPIEIKYKHTLNSSDFKGIKKFLIEYPDTRHSFLINLADNTSRGQTKLATPFELHTIL